MATRGRTLPAGPIVLVIDPDPATQVVLEWAAELEGLKPIVVSTASDAYGIFAEESNQIILVILDIARSTEEGVAARRLQLDAPRIATIPAVVLCDRPITDVESAALQPAITVLKPLQVEEAREIMRGGRSATWREGVFVRGLSGGGRGVALH